MRRGGALGLERLLHEDVDEPGEGYSCRADGGKRPPHANLLGQKIVCGQLTHRIMDEIDVVRDIVAASLPRAPFAYHAKPQRKQRDDKGLECKHEQFVIAQSEGERQPYRKYPPSPAHEQIEIVIHQHSGVEKHELAHKLAGEDVVDFRAGVVIQSGEYGAVDHG